MSKPKNDRLPQLIKYIGGKYSQLDNILPFFPKKITGRYIEPFCGSAACFFGAFAERVKPEAKFCSDITSQIVWLNDSNGYLIEFLSQLRERPEGLIEEIEQYFKGHLENPEQHYYKTRATFPLPECSSGAFYYYVNKFGFNGLWRVNNQGMCNVPWNKKTTVKFDPDVIRLHAKLLSTFDLALSSLSFEEVMEDADKGDFFYLDPPYLPVSGKSYTSYNLKDFTKSDHLRLSGLCLELNKRGSKFALSSSDNSLYREIFSDYNIRSFDSRWIVSSDKTTRVSVKELLITNY